jgi:hypothetical protein
MNETDVYRTKDLQEASFLVVSKKNLIRIDKEPDACYFVFSSHKECVDLSDQFWRRSARVDPKEYADCLRSLKDRIFQVRRAQS